MTQQQHAIPAGRVAKCPKCGGQPHHVEHFGRSRAEAMDFSIPAHRHSIECPCGRSTAKHAALADAEAEWGVVDSQIPMPLPINVARIEHGRRKAKAVRS